MYEDAVLTTTELDLADSDINGRYYNIGFRLLSKQDKTIYTAWLIFDTVTKNLYNYQYFGSEDDEVWYQTTNGDIIKIVDNIDNIERPYIEVIRRLYSTDKTVLQQIEKLIVDSLL